MPVFRGKADLLRKFREGESAALAEVYWAYADKVAGIIRHGSRLNTGGAGLSGLKRRPEEVADLVQDVFLKAFAPLARQGFDGLRDYGPYLFAIARNVLTDWARRQGREVVTEAAALQALADERVEEGDGLDPDTMAVLRGYLAELDPELCAVHEARYRRGLTQQEAAQELGLTRQALRTLEQRLRTGLRRALKRRALGTR